MAYKIPFHSDMVVHPKATAVRKEITMQDYHEIKLRIEFCDAVLKGIKSFEIRKNDRGYQTGDLIRFIPVDETTVTVPHPISDEQFRIMYILNGWGLQDGYVALAIEKVPKDGKSLKDLWEKARNGHTLTGEEVKLLTADWDDRNGFDKYVKCKDCIHGEPVINGAGEDAIECHWGLGPCHTLEWHCADGERRTEV